MVLATCRKKPVAGGRVPRACSARRTSPHCLQLQPAPSQPGWQRSLSPRRSCNPLFVGPWPVAVEMTTSLQNHAAGWDKKSGVSITSQALLACVTEQKDGRAGILYSWAPRRSIKEAITGFCFTVFLGTKHRGDPVPVKLAPLLLKATLLLQMPSGALQAVFTHYQPPVNAPTTGIQRALPVSHTKLSLTSLY